MAGSETKEEKKRRKQEKKDQKKEKKKEKKKESKKKRHHDDHDATEGKVGPVGGDERVAKRRRKAPHDGGDEQRQQHVAPTPVAHSSATPTAHHSSTEENASRRGAAVAVAASASHTNLGALAAQTQAQMSDSTISSPFRLKKIRTIVSLSPSSLSDVKGNIRRLSCEAITRYTTGLDGVLMAVRGVRVCDKEGSTRKDGGVGRVLNELPHVHFNVEADVVVFNPEVGMKLTGEVNESFPSHVGMLVNAFFNAMVPAEHLRGAGYNFDSDQNEWTTERNVRTGERLAVPAPINVGDSVSFTVQKTHECNGIISIEGFEPSVLGAA